MYIHIYTHIYTSIYTHMSTHVWTLSLIYDICFDLCILQQTLLVYDGMYITHMCMHAVYTYMKCTHMIRSHIS